jgi:prepilin-type N-terminal cleavage/methylation domain-containing protein
MKDFRFQNSECRMPATASRRGAAVVAGNPHSTLRTPHSLRAFTLIEILATLALVAIILPVVMAGISLALSTADNSRHQTEAARLAQTKMAELIAAADFQTLEQSGDFAPDLPDYHWNAILSDYDAALGLKELDVEVYWNSRNRDRSVTLSTLVYTGGST